MCCLHKWLLFVGYFLFRKVYLTISNGFFEFSMILILSKVGRSSSGVSDKAHCKYMEKSDQDILRNFFFCKQPKRHGSEQMIQFPFYFLNYSLMWASGQALTATEGRHSSLQSSDGKNANTRRDHWARNRCCLFCVWLISFPQTSNFTSLCHMAPRDTAGEKNSV